MSGFLTQAVESDRVESAPLRELARVEHAGKVLAVCERAGGALILCREREVGVSVEQADGSHKRDRKAGTEKVLKPTAALADFAHAVEAGLL